MKLQLRSVQLFASNLWLATQEKGRPTVSSCHTIPYFIAVKRLHGAVRPPCWKPIPVQGVLRPGETFSSPPSAAVRNRLYRTKYSFLASVWTLLISANLSVGFLAAIFLKINSWSLVSCKAWKWDFQWMVGSSACKTLFAGVFQPPSRAQKMPQSLSVMKAAQI